MSVKVNVQSARFLRVPEHHPRASYFLMNWMPWFHDEMTAWCAFFNILTIERGFLTPLVSPNPPLALSIPSSLSWMA